MAALSGGGQGCLQFVIRLASLLGRKRTVANQRIFLDDRNRLRSGARIHDDTETHLMASLLAQLHRLGILIEQRFSKSALRGSFIDSAMFGVSVAVVFVTGMTIHLSKAM